MNEREQALCQKTSAILGKDTKQMLLNDVIEELVEIIETKNVVIQELQKPPYADLDD